MKHCLSNRPSPIIVRKYDKFAIQNVQNGGKYILILIVGLITLLAFISVKSK